MLSGASPLNLLTPGAVIACDRSRCLRHRFSPSGCQLCMEACPHGAIAWDVAAGLQRDQRACRGCLLCAAVCPTGALAPNEISLVALLQQLSEVGQPVLACSTRPAGQGHARLPCLGLLADPELLLAFQLLLEKPLKVNLTGCIDCHNAAICAPLADACAQLQALQLDGLAPIHLVTAADELGFQEKAVSRRELFSLLRSKTRQGAATALERIRQAPGRIFRDKALPSGRTLLLKVLEHLPDRQLAARIALVFPKLEWSKDCTGCTGCVGICPTGALTAAEASGAPPDFQSTLCTDCQLCMEFCRHSAITAL